MQTRFQVEINGHFPIIYFLPFLIAEGHLSFIHNCKQV